VRAALEIASEVPTLALVGNLAEPLAVRVGIATGPVVVGEVVGEGAAQEHDVVGETPNLAARLQGLAQPNAVVIGEKTHKLIGAAFELEDLGSHVLKGFDAPLPAWCAVGTAEVESRFEAFSTGNLTPFVGREHEINLVEDRWRHAIKVEGQVVLLCGEPGIGKSRITLTTRDQIVSDDFARVRYQCSPYHRSSALYPVIEHLQRDAGFIEGDSDSARLDKLECLLAVNDTRGSQTMAILAALLSISSEGRYPVLDLDPEVMRERTLDALLNGLELLARRQPLFILVEDVHWADPTTLVLLNSMVEQIRSWPALLMITFRPEFDPPWAGEAHVSLLSLNRLDRGQCESMISMLTGGKAVPQEIVEQIALKTDGVPLFVEELTKTILESDLLTEEQDSYVLSGSMQPFSIPTTLQDSLMARLDQLDDAKTLAQIGAAIGREFSQALLAAASGFEPDAITPALDRLVGAGLVFRRGSGARAYYVFKHALVQDAAYNSMLKSRRHTLHGHIAEALLQHFPDMARGQPKLLAQHYTAATLDDKALPYWRTAGQRAMERSAHEESISHFRAGLECLTRIETDQVVAAQTVEFKTSIAECLRVIDLIDEAFSTLQEAEDIATKFELTRHLAQIHHQRGNLYFPLAKTDECLAEHQRGLEYAQAAGSVEEEVRSLGGLGDAYYVSGRMRTAKHYFEQCVLLAQRHGFSKTAAANLSMRGFSRAYLLELREAWQGGTDAIALAKEAGHPRAQLLGHIMTSWTNYYMGNYEQSIQDCEYAQELTLNLGARRFETQNQYYRALSLHRLGHDDEAMALLDEAEPAARKYSPSFTLVRVLGGIALISKDPGRRQRVLAEAEHLLDAGSVSHNYFAFYVDAAESAFEHGQWDRMEYYADRMEAYAHAEPLPWSDFVSARARAMAAFGRGDRSPEIFQQLRQLREQANAAGLVSQATQLDAALSSKAQTGEVTSQ
jgi:predicted ATPase